MSALRSPLEIPVPSGEVEDGSEVEIGFYKYCVCLDQDSTSTSWEGKYGLDRRVVLVPSSLSKLSQDSLITILDRWMPDVLNVCLCVVPFQRIVWRKITSFSKWLSLMAARAHVCLP